MRGVQVKYFRVAFRVGPVGSSILADQPVIWKWRSTLLTSPHALFTLLRVYQAVPREHIRIFFTSSEDEMEQMLLRQNRGLLTTSLTAEQFLINRNINLQEIRRLELEMSARSVDHNEPYIFTAPSSVKEMNIWLALRRKIQKGHFEP